MVKKCGPSRIPEPGRKSQITPRSPSSLCTASKPGTWTVTVPPRRSGSRGERTSNPARSASSINNAVWRSEQARMRSTPTSSTRS